MTGDRTKALGRLLLIAERTSRIQQNHSRAVVLQGGTGGQCGKASQGITGNHRGTTDPFMDVSHKLVAPEAASVGQSLRLGTASKAQQVQGVHLIAGRQSWNVVSPVIGGRTESVHQQHRGLIL